MHPRALASAALAATLLSLPGCLVVIDRDHEASFYSDGDASPRTHLGITTERPEAAMAAQLSIDRDRATTVTYVYPNSAADRAGLRRYDIITAIDANDCMTPTKLRETIRTHKKGDAVKITYLREGKPAETTATLD